jgi:hypothetical protein
MDKLDALVWTGQFDGGGLLEIARRDVDRSVARWAERADASMWSAEQLDVNDAQIRAALDHYRDVRVRLEQARRVLR